MKHSFSIILFLFFLLINFSVQSFPIPKNKKAVFDVIRKNNIIGKHEILFSESNGNLIIETNIDDISGNFINKLTENYYSPGSYKVYWDASNFSSGIYIYEIQLDNYSLRKKMVLVK